jgi:uncharacterized protein (TIGR00297 family)
MARLTFIARFYSMMQGSKITPSLPPHRLWTPRRILHLSLTIPAFLLCCLNWYQTVGLALLILLLEIVILPGLGIDLAKTNSLGKNAREPDGRAGILLYPISLLTLALIFYRHLAVVAAAWGVLGLGDIMAAVAGERWGRRHLPFNGGKTWAGFLSFIGFGAAGGFVLLLWASAGMPVTKALKIGIAAGIVGALVESLPIRLDDNVTVPFVCAGFIFCAALISQVSFDENLPYLGVRIFLAVAINAVFALLAWRLRHVTRSGAAVGFCLGVAVYMGFGYKSFLILLGFFVLASVATRLGYTTKLARGIAEKRQGARSWREAMGNLLPAAWFAILVITTPYQAAFLIAMLAALAEAAGDTVASEMGKWLSPKAWLITSLKSVPAGEDGGISLAGTAAGIAASALIVALGYGLHLATLEGAALAFLAAVAGNFADSILGATLERRRLVSNAIVNFAGTGFAGSLALAFALHH